MSKKLTAVILISTMIAVLISGCATPSGTSASDLPLTTQTTIPMTTEPAKIEPVVDEVKLASGNTAYVYNPSSDLMGLRSCANPVFIVYGNENFTLESAKTTAENSALAEMAAAEGSVIIMINPLGGTWAEADTKTYLSLYAITSDSGGLKYVNGKTEGAAPVYSGARQRFYIYADGAGADFVAKYSLFGPAVTTKPDFTPASVTLCNLSSVPVFAPQGVDIPVITVNAPVGIEEQLKIASPSGLYKMETSDVKSGFDSKIISSTYADLAGAYRRELGVLNKIPNYPALGITQTIRTETLSTGDIEYYEYIPENLDMTKAASVPLIMIFHGVNSHAEYLAWASEWPLAGKANGLMVVSVNQYRGRTTEDIIELLEALEAKYPAIDKTRIYASGFSMGGSMSWSLGINHSDVFAGILPTDLGILAESGASAEINGNIMPVYYVAGGISMLPERPNQDGMANDVDRAIAAIFKMNKVTDSYVFEASAGIWGMKADQTASIPNTTYTNSIQEISYYQSTDGNTYTALCVDTNKPHEVFALDAYAGWEFIKQFSRNADGTITLK